LNNLLEVWILQLIGLITEMQLTLEQQLQLRNSEIHVDKMNLEQTQFFLKELYKQMIIKEVMYQNLLKKNWNIEELSNQKWKTK
jgi:hypothetical protein